MRNYSDYLPLGWSFAKRVFFFCWHYIFADHPRKEYLNLTLVLHENLFYFLPMETGILSSKLRWQKIYSRADNQNSSKTTIIMIIMVIEQFRLSVLDLIFCQQGFSWLFIAFLLVVHCKWIDIWHSLFYTETVDDLLSEEIGFLYSKLWLWKI